MIIRTPTALQNILQSHGAWWEYYNKHRETISDDITDNVIKIMSCGRFIKGYKEYHCSNKNCEHVKFVTQSCNSRFCPTCGKRATDQWIIQQHKTLPQCEYQHITFTMPKPLWPFFHRHRELLNHLSKLAANIIIKLAKKRGITVGIFTALHTFGRDLQWHPHIHLSVTMGGICDKTGEFKPIKFAKKAVMPMWRFNLIKFLRKAAKQNIIQTPHAFLSKQYNRYWHIHFSKPTKEPYPTISYLGRYIKKPPISLSKLKHYDDKNLTFSFLNHRTQKYKKITMSIEHFIYLFTQHIPKKGMRLIRYYGFLSNRVRGKLLGKVYQLLNQMVYTAPFFGYRGQHINNFGFDPFECTLCQSQMVFHSANPGMSHKQIKQHHKALATRQIINH